VCESKDLVEVSPGVWLPQLLEGTITGRTPAGEETLYVRERLEITVNSVNATYAPDFFRLKIPPGCRVLDETLKTLYRPGEMDIKSEEIQESAQTFYGADATFLGYLSTEFCTQPVVNRGMGRS